MEFRHPSSGVAVSLNFSPAPAWFSGCVFRKRWHSFSRPLIPDGLTKPPFLPLRSSSPPSVALRTQIDKDTVRLHHPLDQPKLLPTQSWNFSAANLRIVLRSRYSSHLRLLSAFLSPCPRRLYVVGILLEKYLCNIACNLAVDSSSVDLSLAYESSFACIQLHCDREKNTIKYRHGRF